MLKTNSNATVYITYHYNHVLYVNKGYPILIPSGHLKYELAPVLISNADIISDMRISKCKLTIKKINLPMEVSLKQSFPPDIIILDGCGVL